MKSTVRFTAIVAATSFSLLMQDTLCAQPKDTNYDEAKVPKYTLPDPLVAQDGTPITTSRQWRQKRRPEVLRLFQAHVYGRSPARPSGMKWEVTSLEKNALGGKATRKEVSIYFTGRKDGPKMDLLIYLPNHAQKPVPTFLGLNFNGNQAIHADPGITISKQWMRPGRDGGVVNNRATEQARGTEASRWAVEKILSRGYALATAYYGDLEPDHAEGWKTGVRSHFMPKPVKEKQGPQPPPFPEGVAHAAPPDAPPDAWGGIGAFAWGLSRALDYLEKDKEIDAKRVAVMGHSRLGKTALWAGAQDERVAIAISNNSGEGGASLSRRRFGETVERINAGFPHWFCKNFKSYNNRENDLPVDQHMLVALMAPRPVYVASAQEDLWADPRGEFLSAKHAEPVYRLCGKDGLGVDDMPSLNQPVGNTIGYHIRTGKHDVTDYDWEQYLNFADRHFEKR